MHKHTHTYSTPLSLLAFPLFPLMLLGVHRCRRALELGTAEGEGGASQHWPPILSIPPAMLPVQLL
jgi:hypothetical protein